MQTSGFKWHLRYDEHKVLIIYTCKNSLYEPNNKNCMFFIFQKKMLEQYLSYFLNRLSGILLFLLRVETGDY